MVTGVYYNDNIVTTQKLLMSSNFYKDLGYMKHSSLQIQSFGLEFL